MQKIVVLSTHHSSRSVLVRLITAEYRHLYEEGGEFC